MTTGVLAIRDSMLASIRAASLPGVASDGIFADKSDARGYQLCPLVVLDLGDELAPVSQFGKKQRVFDLIVDIVADGDDPYSVADPIREAVHAVVMADKTIGGLADSIIEGTTIRDRSDIDIRVGKLSTTYSITYFTALDDLA